MPKLPKISNTVFLSILILIALLGLAAYLLASNNPTIKRLITPQKVVVAKDPASEAKPEIKSYFNGSVDSINHGGGELTVKNFEGKIFQVKIDQNTKITADGKDVAFGTVAVNDQVTLYSNRSEATDANIYLADWIDKALPFDPKTVNK